MGLPWCWKSPRLCWQTWNKNNWSNQGVVEVVNPLYHWTRKPDGRRRKREKRRSPARSWSARDGSPMVSRDGWMMLFDWKIHGKIPRNGWLGVTPYFFWKTSISDDLTYRLFHWASCGCDGVLSICPGDRRSGLHGAGCHCHVRVVMIQIHGIRSNSSWYMLPKNLQKKPSIGIFGG